MGFFKTVGKGLKQAGTGIKKAANDFDEFQEKNRTKQMERMDADLMYHKKKTALMKEKKKQSKYGSNNSPFGFN